MTNRPDARDIDQIFREHAVHGALVQALKHVTTTLLEAPECPFKISLREDRCECPAHWAIRQAHATLAKAEGRDVYQKPCGECGGKMADDECMNPQCGEGPSD